MALVGHSGSGKTSTFSMLQRFYDPIGGSVRLDGRDLRDYNIMWLRSHIGVGACGVRLCNLYWLACVLRFNWLVFVHDYAEVTGRNSFVLMGPNAHLAVSQMPTLFALSIADNIALGAGLVENKVRNAHPFSIAACRRDGFVRGDSTHAHAHSPYHLQELTIYRSRPPFFPILLQDFDPRQPENAWSNRRLVPVTVSREEIEKAAKLANAYDFIMRLPAGFDTVVCTPEAAGVDPTLEWLPWSAG